MINIKNIPCNWQDESRAYFTDAEVRALLSSSYDAFFSICSGEDREYFTGHRSRFEETLKRMPKASFPGEKILDIGGLELTAYWLMLYGYEVVQFNYDPSLPIGHIAQGESVLPVAGENRTYKRVNVHLEKDWPNDTRYSTIFFTETLEHLSDPLIAMHKLNAIAEPNAFILLTTPNAHSLFALVEFLKGLPAWVYRYFNTDMGIFRHQFEQTPYTMCELSEVTGFSVKGLSTHCVYGGGEDHFGYDVLQKWLHNDIQHLGEVMIVCLKKIHDAPCDQTSLCLYDATRFYQTLDHEFVAVYRDKIALLADDLECRQKLTTCLARDAEYQKELVTRQEAFAEYICNLERQNRISKMYTRHVSLKASCKNVLRKYPAVYSAARSAKQRLAVYKHSALVHGMYERCKRFVKAYPPLYRAARRLKVTLRG